MITTEANTLPDFLEDELSKFQIFEDLYEDGSIEINFFWNR